MELLRVEYEQKLQIEKRVTEEKVVIYETRIKEINDAHSSEQASLHNKFEKERTDLTNSYEFKLKNLNNTIAELNEKLRNFGQNNNEKVKALENTIDSLKKEIENKSNSLANSEGKIKDLEENIRKLNDKIKGLEAEIDSLKTEMNKKEKEFQEQLLSSNSSTDQLHEKYRRELKELEANLKQKHEEKVKEYLIN